MGRAYSAAHLRQPGDARPASAVVHASGTRRIRPRSRRIASRRRIILEENEITRGLPGKYVDGRLEFRWKGISLPYSDFDKDQRVTHTAVTENKYLGAVLEFIKEDQDKAQPKKRRAGTQHTRYEPTGRRNDGWNSKLALRARECAASQGCDI
jgi:hypothetical protein